MILSFMCVSLAFTHAAGMKRGQGQGKNRSLNTQQPAFSFFDLNSDKLISAEEFTQARTKRMEDKISEGRALQNRNQARNFTELDADGDGFINSNEFQAHQRNTVKNQTQSKTKLKAKINKQSNKNKQKMQSKWAHRQQSSFSEFDADGDKQISKEEFNAWRRERTQKRTEEGRALQNRRAFASYDKNKDGVLSEEEFIAYPYGKNAVQK